MRQHKHKVRTCTDVFGGQTVGLKKTVVWEKRERKYFSFLFFLVIPRTGVPIRVKFVTHVLQMLEASRNASRFADTIEYTIFAQVSGIT